MKGHRTASTQQACFLIPTGAVSARQPLSYSYARWQDWRGTSHLHLTPIGQWYHGATLKVCTENSRFHNLSGAFPRDTQRLSLNRQLLDRHHNLSDMDALWWGPSWIYNVPLNLKYLRSLTLVARSAFILLLAEGTQCFLWVLVNKSVLRESGNSFIVQVGIYFMGASAWQLIRYWDDWETMLLTNTGSAPNTLWSHKTKRLMFFSVLY